MRDKKERALLNGGRPPPRPRPAHQTGLSEGWREAWVPGMDAGDHPNPAGRWPAAMHDGERADEVQQSGERGGCPGAADAEGAEGASRAAGRRGSRVRQSAAIKVMEYVKGSGPRP